MFGLFMFLSASYLLTTFHLHLQLHTLHTISHTRAGKTTIDLEDRWFDARWQKMGEENVLMPGSDPNDPTKVR